MQIILEIEAEKFIAPFIGKPVSRVWQGSGTAIFLEIGELTKNKGELTIMIEWSWRVEGLKQIRFGSFSEYSELPEKLKELLGLTIREISFQTRLVEVVVELSCSTWLSSFSTVDGDPQWALITPSRTLFSSQGEFRIE